MLLALAFMSAWTITAQQQAAHPPGLKAPSVRLAIISEEPSATSVADVLTAELSPNPGLQLLERNEIDKAYREQALSAGNKDYLKLGQILGADGLLLFSALAEGPNHFLQARLVAVKPGVVIGSVRSPWPFAETTQLASRIARHFAPLLPKLSILAKDAIPISIVNLRSAVRSGEAEETERQLTPLAVERLSREREFFVLERQRMELLSNEKDLRGGNESAFWNGSHLLEGVLDRDGYSKGTLTLSARLVPAKGGTPVPIEVSGSRTNLTEVLNRLANKVKEALKLGSRSTPWDTQEESAQYFQEAKWAFKWGMLSEAQSACESSWALGNATKQVAELRIRIYREEGDSPQQDWLYQSPTSPAYTPDIAKLEPAIRSLELYQQGLHSFVLNEPKPDTSWYYLGMELLSTDLLRRFNYFPAACQGHEQQLAALRQLSRSTADLLQSQPNYTNLNPPLIIVRLGGEACYEAPSKDSKSGIEARVARFSGAYWPETPEQAVELYRQLGNTSFLHSGRNLFAHHVIAGWNEADKARVPALWQAFIDELCGSSNALKRLEGYYLSFANAKPPQQQERAAALFKLAIETAGPLRAAGLDEGLVHDIDYLIADMPQGFPGASISQSTGQSFSAFRSQFKTACETALKNVGVEAMKNYLSTALSNNTPADPMEFQKLFLTHVSYSANGALKQEPEMRALIPPVREYKKVLEERLQRQGGTPPMILQLLSRYLSDLEGSFAPPANPQPATNLSAQVQPPASPPRQPAGPPPQRFGPGRQPFGPARPEPNPIKRQVPTQIGGADQGPTNVLTITRVWPWPTDLVADAAPVPTAVAACFRNGRLWIEVMYKTEGVRLCKALVFGLDLGTFSTEVVELPLLDFKLVYSATESEHILDTGNSFEVLGDCLVFSVADKLKRFSFKSRTWEDLAVPTAGRLTLLDDRLFATTDDSIVEVSTRGDSQTILASARRRPPATILDSLENYRQPPIFHGPNGSIATWIHERLYALDEKTKAWSAITNLTNLPSCISKRPATEVEGLSYRVMTRGTEQVFIPHEQSSMPLAVPPPPVLSFRKYPVGHRPFMDEPWGILASQDLMCSRIFLPGTGAWVFLGEDFYGRRPAGKTIMLGNRKVSLAADKLPSLFAYWPDLGDPVAVPIELDSNNARLVRLQSYRFRSTLFGQVIPTPAGIAAIIPEFGLWLIPWNDLAAVMKAVKEPRLAQRQAQLSVINTLWTNLFQKYHFTQRDNFTPEQKEAMIEDPIFLELNLDKIDANQNGRLDAEELVYFDANRNGKLEPVEETGIEVSQSLLAQRVMDESDLDHDAQLNGSELNNLLLNTRDSNTTMRLRINLFQFDRNHDGMLSLAELTSLLTLETVRSIEATLESAASARTVIERYWHKSGDRVDGGVASGALQMIKEAQSRGKSTNAKP
jgi:hypothetical protein